MFFVGVRGPGTLIGARELLRDPASDVDISFGGLMGPGALIGALELVAAPASEFVISLRPIARLPRMGVRRIDRWLRIM